MKRKQEEIKETNGNRKEKAYHKEKWKRKEGKNGKDREKEREGKVKIQVFREPTQWIEKKGKAVLFNILTPLPYEFRCSDAVPLECKAHPLLLLLMMVAVGRQWHLQQQRGGNAPLPPPLHLLLLLPQQHTIRPSRCSQKTINLNSGCTPHKSDWINTLFLRSYIRFILRVETASSAQ